MTTKSIVVSERSIRQSSVFFKQVKARAKRQNILAVEAAAEYLKEQVQENLQKQGAGKPKSLAQLRSEGHPYARRHTGGHRESGFQVYRRMGLLQRSVTVDYGTARGLSASTRIVRFDPSKIGLGDGKVPGENDVPYVISGTRKMWGRNVLYLTSMTAHTRATTIKILEEAALAAHKGKRYRRKKGML